MPSPSVSSNPKSIKESEAKQNSNHPHSSGMALPILVFFLGFERNQHITLLLQKYITSQNSGLILPLDPVCLHLTADFWLMPMDKECSLEVQSVLLQSRKPWTRKTYMAKWKRFSICAKANECIPISSISLNLNYLSPLKHSGLSLNSIKVH